jgi:hypothetical protein
VTGCYIRPDRTRPVLPTIGARTLIGLCGESGLNRSDASLWNLSGHDRTLLLVCLVMLLLVSGALWIFAAMMNSRVIVSSPLAFSAPGAWTDAAVTRVTWSDASVPSGGCIRSSLPSSSSLVSSRSWRSAWFLTSCLELAWFLGSSIILLRSFLRCLSSDHHVTFVQVTFASYWTTKQTLANSLVQFGCVGHQTPKSKVNRPRVHFPYTCLVVSSSSLNSQNAFFTYSNFVLGCHLWNSQNFILSFSNLTQYVI